MKRIILMLSIFVAAIAIPAFADEDKPITVEELPVAAKEFINQYFFDVKVSFAKVENDWFDKSYEVVFTDGSKIEFDGNGNWEKVDCKVRKVPYEIVPEKIKEHIRVHFPDVIITKIEKDKRDYEIKLSNGYELTFDLKFNLIEIDD